MYFLLLIHFFPGVLTLLKFPYPRYVDEPETYDQIRVHAEWGTEFKKQNDGAPVFAVSEGGGRRDEREGGREGVGREGGMRGGRDEREGGREG